jgi:hypothetical protein
MLLKRKGVIANAELHATLAATDLEPMRGSAEGLALSRGGLRRGEGSGGGSIREIIGDWVLRHRRALAA